MVMKIVLDTNVLYAALRSGTGASAGVLKSVVAGQIDLLLSVALAYEYTDVLLRDPRVFARESRDVHDLIDFLIANSLRSNLPRRDERLAGDVDDERVAQLALYGQSDHLVTHNTRHFRPLIERGISVVTPAMLITMRKERYE